MLDYRDIEMALMDYDTNADVLALEEMAQRLGNYQTISNGLLIKSQLLKSLNACLIALDRCAEHGAVDFIQETIDELDRDLSTVSDAISDAYHDMLFGDWTDLDWSENDFSLEEEEELENILSKENLRQYLSDW